MAERYAALEMLQENFRESKRVTSGWRQGLRHGRFCARVPEHVGDAACGAKPWAKRWQRHRQSHGAARGLCDQSEEERKRIEECFGWLKTIALLRKVRHRGTLKVDWIFTFACRGLQSGAHAEPDAQRSSDVVHDRAAVCLGTELQRFFGALGSTEKITPQILENSHADAKPRNCWLRTDFPAAC